MTILTKKNAKNYILAPRGYGKAIVTFENTISGKHHTFKITKADSFIPRYFVAALVGPKNENDYVYMGMIFKGEFRATKASNSNHSKFKVFAQVWRLINRAQDLPDWLEILHSGKCSRCNRTLTTPESVEFGIGPECRRKLGL